MLEHMLDEKDDTQMKLDLLDELMALIDKRRGDGLPAAKPEVAAIVPEDSEAMKPELEISISDEDKDEDEI